MPPPLDIRTVGLHTGGEVRRSPVHERVAAATAVTEALREAHPPHHADEADLVSLYSTILTDEARFTAEPADPLGPGFLPS